MHQNLGLLLLREIFPLLGRKERSIIICSIHRCRTAFFKCRHKLLYRASLVHIAVIPRPEHLEECPLRPLVIVGIRGAEFPLPVIREANTVKLAAVAGDILEGRLLRMLAGLDGILLGGKAKSIIAHRMQDIKTFKSLITGEYIAGYVTERMTDMEPGT